MKAAHQRKVFLLKPEYPCYAVSGSRGAGKSALVEFIENYYYEHNYVICDWFGSLDLENAFSCIADVKEVAALHLLPGDHSFRLLEYLSAVYDIDLKDAIIENTSNTLRISKDKHKILINFDSFRGRAAVSVNGKKGHAMLLRKNDAKESCLFGRNPQRRREERVRLVGLPTLIVLPKSTIVTPRNPLCVCGVPLSDHDDGRTYYCKNKLELIKTITDDVPLKGDPSTRSQGKALLRH